MTPLKSTGRQTLKPISPSRHRPLILPPAEGKVLDADELERWLISPSKSFEASSSCTPSFGMSKPSHEPTQHDGAGAKKQPVKLEEEVFQRQVAMRKEEEAIREPLSKPESQQISPHAAMRRIKQLRKQRELRKKRRQKAEEKDSQSTVPLNTDNSITKQGPYISNEIKQAQTANKTTDERIFYSFDDSGDAQAAVISEDEEEENKNTCLDKRNENFSTKKHETPKSNVNDSAYDRARKDTGQATMKVGDGQRSFQRGAVASRSIRYVRKQRHQRLQQRELDDEFQELETEYEKHQLVSSKARIVTPTSTQTGSLDDENFIVIPGSMTPKYQRPSNASPTQSPLIAPVRLDIHGGTDGMASASFNEKADQVFTLSPTRKIHLLKRHDPGTNKSPLISVSSGHGRSEHDGGESAEIAQVHHDRTMITSQVSSPPRRETNEEQSPKHNGFEISEENNARKIRGNEVNTKLIKEAVARSRHKQRSKSTTYDLNADCIGIAKEHMGIATDESETVLKNRFQSGSISCSSFSTGGVSTGSGTSEGSSEEYSSFSNGDRDEDETTDVTSTTEVSDEIGGGNGNLYSDSVHHVGKSKSFEMSALDKKLNSLEDKYAVRTAEEEESERDIILGSDTLGNDRYSEVDIASHRGPMNESVEEQVQIHRRRNDIKLNVYDLLANDTQLDVWGCHFPLGQVFNAVNSSLHSIGTGAYHVGLEIDGVEYAYGANNTKGLTGVFTCVPKNSPGYQFRTTIDFGSRFVVRKSRKGVNKKANVVDGGAIVKAMASEYLGTEYDLLRKNCCTFAHDACIRLGIHEDEIPSWFHNLAQMGALTQDAATYTLAPLTQLFETVDVDRLTDYVNETSWDEQNKKIKQYEDEHRIDDSEPNEPIVDASTAYQF